MTKKYRVIVYKEPNDHEIEADSAEQAENLVVAEYKYDTSVERTETFLLCPCGEENDTDATECAFCMCPIATCDCND